MGTRSILIVDDEVSFAELVKMNLEASGNYRVRTASSGKEGIKIARDLRPDVILLDINMPKMDGFEVLEELKADPKTISIPVIMLSARSEESSKIRASELYSENYITKPVSTEDLVGKIEGVLKIGRR